MAILKHIASKNADYGEAQRYLLFQYDESTNKPILDEKKAKGYGQNIVHSLLLTLLSHTEYKK